jgi:hypothetical protein
MVSCLAREQTRAATIASLKSSGWAEDPVVCLEDPECKLPLHRHMMLVRTTLELARRNSDAEMILLLEDDVIFNRRFKHNLEAWEPLRAHRPGNHFFASLFNPGVRFLRFDPALACAEAQPDSVCGAQALLIDRQTAHLFATCWGVIPALHADIKLARLAALVCPILYHVPSLVQHIGLESRWNGPFLSANDFEAEWLAAQPGRKSTPPKVERIQNEERKRKRH